MKEVEIMKERGTKDKIIKERGGMNKKKWEKEKYDERKKKIKVEEKKNK